MEGPIRDLWLLRDLIAAAHRETQRALGDALVPLGLSAVCAEALIVLAAQGQLTIGELSRQLIAESDHPSRLVARLADKGLVVRRPDPTDARATQVTLTDEGQQAAERVLAAVADLDDRVSGRLRRHDIDACARTLARLLEPGRAADAVRLRHPVELQESPGEPLD